MKIGIIIVFHNWEQQIDKNLFILYAQKLPHLKFCLVNNDSKDKTYEILKEIKEQSDNVSIVNIKKFKSDISAVKAGARYMFNQSKFKHLGYINTNLINHHKGSFNSILRALNENQKAIIEFNLKTLHKHEIRQTLFQKLFSIIDCLNKIEIEKQSFNLSTVLV